MAPVATDFPRLNCYLCVWTVPCPVLTSCSSRRGVTAAQSSAIVPRAAQQGVRYSMPKVFVPLLLLLPLVALAQQGTDARIREALKHCESDSLSEKLCAAHRFQEADKELNRVYSEQMNRLKNDKPKERLRAAQRTWLKFRNEDCSYQGWATEQGSIHPYIVSECMTRHTKRRIEDIKNFIECTQAGCPW
jgi:uncharacterized protein YecT (DUF1311 family)